MFNKSVFRAGGFSTVDVEITRKGALTVRRGRGLVPTTGIGSVWFGPRPRRARLPVIGRDGPAFALAHQGRCRPS